MSGVILAVCLYTENKIYDIFSCMYIYDCWNEKVVGSFSVLRCTRTMMPNANDRYTACRQLSYYWKNEYSFIARITKRNCIGDDISSGLETYRK